MFTEAQVRSIVVGHVKMIVKGGSPCLVGTRLIEYSSFCRLFLLKKEVKHNVLKLKQHEREAQTVCLMQVALVLSLLLQILAGRGTDIVLGGNLQVSWLN